MRLKLYEKQTPPSLFSWDIEDLFDFPFERKSRAFPACDFREEKDSFFISLDLPGLKKESIKINCESAILTVSGERREERVVEDQKSHSHFAEKFYGSFKRSFPLPSSIDEKKITAHFADGVLELSLPKADQSKGRDIPITEGKREGGLSKLLKKQPD